MNYNIDNIIKYENGEMNSDEILELFQALIDSGLAWKLQGHYGRVAAKLIKEGFCHEKNEPTNR